MKKPMIIAGAVALLCLFSACNSVSDSCARAEALYRAGNYAEAVPLFHQAAESGSAQAQLMLGKCYDLGHGVVADPAQAVAWYRKSASAGNSDAQDNLGTCYAEGFGVQKISPLLILGTCKLPLKEMHMR